MNKFARVTGCTLAAGMILVGANVAQANASVNSQIAHADVKVSGQNAGVVTPKWTPYYGLWGWNGRANCWQYVHTTRIPQTLVNRTPYCEAVYRGKRYGSYGRIMRIVRDKTQRVILRVDVFEPNTRTIVVVDRRLTRGE